VVAETGFGFGLNFVITANAWLQSSRDNACLHFISIERYPVSPEDIGRLAEQFPELRDLYDALIKQYPPPLPGMHLLEFAQGKIKLYLIFDEIHTALQQITHEVDAWYLDGFAPARNEAMWSQDVFNLIARHSKTGASFATYTASGDVRRGLIQAGFVVQKTAGHGSKRDMLKGLIFDKRSFKSREPWYLWRPSETGNHEVVVIGAGLAGLSVAWAMVKRGWHVTVIDKHDSVGAEASGNPAGLLMPRLSQLDDTDSRFYCNAYVYAINVLEKLQNNSDKHFWYQSGSVLLTSADKTGKLSQQYTSIDEFVSFQTKQKLSAITGVDINRDGFEFTHAGWINTQQLCECLAEACGDALTLVRTNVESISHADHGWKIYLDNKEDIKSNYVVFANAASCRLFSQLEWLPIESVRGQLSYVPATDKSHALKCGISAERYITPEQDGMHVVGASYSAENDSTELNLADHQHNIETLHQVLPGIIDTSVEMKGRVAFRAISKDRVPVVGAIPDRPAFLRDYDDLRHGRISKNYPAGTYQPGLFITSGHGSRGLTTCLLSGEMIAAMITAEPVPVEKKVMDYLNPARFIIRQLKRNRA
jgi:tRNA 5-methylaminomethyl-2-thiouridine biosynthesis bifunctional protein